MNTPDILKQLDTCAGQLDSLGPDTESEFLSIGETLQQLANSCFSMTDDALKLTSLSSFCSDDSETANESFIEKTRAVFSDVDNHVETTMHSLNEGDELLSAILNEVQKLKVPVQDLGRIGRTFKVLGINIKVESSRNEKTKAGFQILAEEVAAISKLVHSNCQYCTDRTDSVASDISASREVLSSGDAQHNKSKEKTAETVLVALEDLSSNAATLAVEIQQRSSAMSQGIGEVVMAMQFHDISRQQLENVAKALQESRSKLRLKADGSLDDENEQNALEVYTILNIQAAHLNSIYEQILRAKEQIRTGLVQTMEQSGLQADNAEALLKIDNSAGQQSVVSTLEQEIDTIVSSLNNSLRVVKHAADVSKDVYDNVSKIGEFVHKIEEIAFDVKILAINAMVEAIRTGETGKTLTVLAQELSNLSKETRSRATDSIELLQQIMERTEKQVEFSTELDQSRSVIDEMIEEAKALTVTILSSMQEVNSLAQKMGTDSQQLSSSINNLIPGIHFPVLMGDRIGENWLTICQIIEKIEETHPEFTEKNPAVEQMLEDLSEKYVMDRERSIHAQVTGGSAVAAASDSDDIELFGDDDDDGIELFDDEVDTETAAQQEDEFDDNIELF